jgi:hypothetical protein
MLGSIAKAIGGTVSDVVNVGSGILGFIGQQGTNQANVGIAQAANAASAEQARAQMDFQERMRATQYQTAVDDMKKAGLNPMLAYQQGGAGTPSGAMGQVSTAKIGNTLGSAVEGYRNMAMTNAELQQKDALTQNTSAQTIKTEADTIQTAVNIGKLLEDTRVSTQTFKNLEVTFNKLLSEIALINAQKPLVQAQTGLAAEQTKNVEKNISPSTDPYWYRDFKRAVGTIRNNPSLLIPFGGSKK